MIGEVLNAFFGSSCLVLAPVKLMSNNAKTIFGLKLEQSVNMGKAPERPSAGTSPGTDAIHVFGLRLEQKVTMGRAPGHPSAGTPQAAMPPGSNAPWVSPTIASGLTMGTRRSGKPGPRR